MARHTTDRDLGLRRITRELHRARVTEVVVGIQQGTMADGEFVATYAAANEYGTSKIPARSFMRSTFDSDVGELRRDMDYGYQQMLAGTMTTRTALGYVGLKHQTAIKAKIGSNIQPANSPYTIARKGSSRTLIDKAFMINGVQYIVRAVR
jgi:hypothetical protein